MFCTNCGKKIPDDLRFCTFCGAPTRRGASDASAPAPAPAPAETPAAPSDEPPAVMPPVEAPAPAMPDAGAPEQPRRSKAPVIAAVSCAVVILGGAGVAAALTGGFGLLGDKGPAASEVTQTYEEPDEEPEAEQPEDESDEQSDSEKPAETQTDASEPEQVTVEQEEAETRAPSA